MRANGGVVPAPLQSLPVKQILASMDDDPWALQNTRSYHTSPQFLSPQKTAIGPQMLKNAERTNPNFSLLLRLSLAISKLTCCNCSSPRALWFQSSKESCSASSNPPNVTKKGPAKNLDAGQVVCPLFLQWDFFRCSSHPAPLTKKRRTLPHNRANFWWSKCGWQKNRITL